MNCGNSAFHILVRWLRRVEEAKFVLHRAFSISEPLTCRYGSKRSGDVLVPEMKPNDCAQKLHLITYQLHHQIGIMETLAKVMLDFRMLIIFQYLRMMLF